MPLTKDTTGVGFIGAGDISILHAKAVARCHGAKLVGVIETHTHADHVSGHGILAQGQGCWIAIHEVANAVYEHRPLRDGDRIDVGNIALDILHTPGHRPEHCCVVVSDRTRGDEPWLVAAERHAACPEHPLGAGRQRRRCRPSARQGRGARPWRRR